MLAIGLAAWRVIAPAGSPCQSTAWNVTPAGGDLPAGWTITSNQYDIDRKSMTLLGPTPSSQTANQAVIYATITCYTQDAADAVKRSIAATTAAGQQVTERPDLGDQGFASVDRSGAAVIQFRHGSVVADIAASGDATSAEANAVASAFDRAMGGNGATAGAGGGNTSVSPASSDAGAIPSGASASESAGASASAAAPELEAALPTVVGTTSLTIQSATGPTVLGTDQGSRAITAALRAVGKTADDFRVAQAFDTSGATDLTIVAISVPGMKPDALRALVLNAWLVATGPGVKTDSIALAGRAFSRVDYGDKGALDYVLSLTDRVIVIQTADANLAGQAAAALH
ncbi:MAG TPA: hypothetical protein VIM30_08420 [Candidatus Limnocylindrales bacterium]